ncbi:MAG: FAD-dependent oxidoreductase [Alphaproteobacteria bacterium]|nr:FAD-dependent oxidoreductase [Alphaproteobacteria bacterium]
MGTDGAWPSACDICVVGGGLAGLATAWRLAQSGQRTVLLERRVPAGAASSANAGTLAIQNKRPPLLPFFRDALAEWARVAEELGVEIGYGKPGGLHIARSNEDAQRLRKNFENHGALGLAGEWLDAAALRAEAPWLGDGIIAATRSPLDAHADPLRAGSAMAAAAEEAGAAILTGIELRGAARDSIGWRLETNTSALRANNVVIASGPWTGRVAALFGANLPVHPSLIMLSVTEPAPRFMDRIVTHVAGNLTVKQVKNGSCLIGGGWPGAGDFDAERPGIDPLMLRHNLRLATDVVPGLANLRLARSWANFEAQTPDGLPIFGAVPDRDGLFVVLPTAGGWTAAPLMGRLMARQIAAGEEAETLAPATPARFSPR